MSRDDNHGTLPDQNTPEGLNDPYSRRRFLRAAVVGTAGVAAAAGVAGVALADANKTPAFLTPVLDGATGPTTTPGANAYFLDTMFDVSGCTSPSYSANGSGQQYFIFQGLNLTAGSYQFELTQQLDSNTAGEIQANGTAATTLTTLPWEYQENPTNGKPIHVGTGTYSGCPTGVTAGGGSSATLTDYHSPYVHDAPLPATAPPPIVEFTLSSTTDIEIFVHLQYGGATPTTGDKTTFTYTLTGPVSFGPTSLVVPFS